MTWGGEVFGAVAAVELDEVALGVDGELDVGAAVGPLAGHVADADFGDGVSGFGGLFDGAGEEGVVEASEAIDFFCGGFGDAGGMFEVDVAFDFAGDDGEDFFEGGDAGAFEFRIEPASGVECAELVEGEVADFACAVGGAVDGGVVHDDEFAVFGELDVEFDHGDTFFDGGDDGGEGVFGRGGNVSAVGAELGGGSGEAAKQRQAEYKSLHHWRGFSFSA